MFYKTKSACRFGKCSYAHRQVDEQPTKRSKKNDDNSAVAMLKKGDWHVNVYGNLLPTMIKVAIDQGNLIRGRGKKLGRGPHRNVELSDARQLGCVFQDMKAAEVYSPEEHRHAEANPTCKIHEGYCASH